VPVSVHPGAANLTTLAHFSISAAMSRRPQQPMGFRSSSSLARTNPSPHAADVGACTWSRQSNLRNGAYGFAALILVRFVEHSSFRRHHAEIAARVRRLGGGRVAVG
jgi:hypothetical protein